MGLETDSSTSALEQKEGTTKACESVTLSLSKSYIVVNLLFKVEVLIDGKSSTDMCQLKPEDAYLWSLWALLTGTLILATTKISILILPSLCLSS